MSRNPTPRAAFPALRASPLWRGVVDRWRRGRCRRKLLDYEPGAPTLEAPVSQAVTRAQLDGPSHRRWCALIREEPRLHRKQWEYSYILSALERAGLLAPGCRGLGFGVGREPLVAAIASRGCEVLATDLPEDAPEAAGWRATGQHGPGLAALNERGICPADEFERLVSFEPRDMRELAPLERGFDFLWSSCALEHLGSLEAGARFVVESLDALRPGGTAVHTTEYNASSNERTVRDGPVVLYRRRDLEALAEGLRREGHAIELDFDTGASPADRYVDIRPYREDLHLKVLYGSFATTSFGLLIRRAGG